MHSAYYHVIIYVPTDYATAVREAAGATGAGKVGNYDNCSFSAKGIGRYCPLRGANPHTGSMGKIEEVEEERIELMVHSEEISTVLQAILNVHPYEEPAIHVLTVIDYKSLLQ